MDSAIEGSKFRGTKLKATQPLAGRLSHEATRT